MRLPFDLPIPDRRRLTAFALAIVVEALLLLLLVLFGPHFTPAEKVKRPSNFSLIPADDTAATEENKTRTKTADQKQAKSSSAPPVPQPPDVTPPPNRPPPPTPLPGVLPIELGTTDIGKIKGSGSEDDAGDGKDSKLAYGPGLGPGGMPLYAAEWYREPSNAELNGYVKKMPEGGGVALIACRTIPAYHVDNCRTLSESPAGSGLARDMREAAWQFLVRPPRRGGKALIGSWVSIRIDFHVTTIKRGAGTPGRSSEGFKLPPEPKPRYGPSTDTPGGEDQSGDDNK